MKNEGLVIVAAFLLSHFRGWTRWPQVLMLLAGIAVPLTVLIAYKTYIPTPNDLLTGISGNPWLKLLEPERYRTIAYYLLRFGVGRFPLFIVFFAWSAWQGRRAGWVLGPGGYSLLLCCAGYFAVYMTTDIGLAWLVPTSLNRLMMQLLPAAVYISIRRLDTPATRRAAPGSSK
jgi:hypothetical protein